jgi:hypothetical protein
MIYVICCACSALCFVCGIWAARGLMHDKSEHAKLEAWTPEADTLTRDIEALLAYTPKKEDSDHADS